MSLLSARKQLLPFFLAALLALLYFLLNFHHMPQFLEWDQIVYANNIIKNYDNPDSYPLYNPHHLHMEIGGKIFHVNMMNLFEDAGFTDLVFNVRLRALIYACIGVFFTVLYLKNITGKLVWGILGAVLISFCHAYLVYATKVDTPIYPAAVMVFILWMLQKLENVKKGLLFFAALAGIVLFISVMAHQYMAFACAILFFSLALPAYFFPDEQALGQYGFFEIIRPKKRPVVDRNPKVRYISTVMMSAIGIILIIVAYFYAGKTEYNLPIDEPDPENARGIFRYSTFSQWLFLYEQSPIWGKGFDVWDPKESFRGFTDSFLSRAPGEVDSILNYDFRYNLDEPFDPPSFVQNQVAYFTIIVLLGNLIFLPGLWKRYRRSYFFIVSCLLIFTVFTSYWQATYYEFWLIPNILLCVLGIFLLNFLAEKLRAVFGRISIVPFYAYIIFLIFLIGNFNIEHHVAPYSQQRVLYAYSKNWDPDYYMKLFSTYIYKNPEEPFKDVY